MAMALRLAKRGQYTSSPNPNVGCVIVKNGKLLCQGFHQQAGCGHAEANAIASAAANNIDISGATCYVTLEPCSHFGRTPPCAQALIDNHVARVVVAMTDPNPQVAGQGLASMRRAGIQVELGLLESQARLLNPGFLSRIERKRPLVRLKLACSIDGKIGLANGQSKWISSVQSRSDVQLERAKSSAILSTANTVLADNASLNVRGDELPKSHCLDLNALRQPTRIIVDRQNQLLPQANLKLWNEESQVLLLQDQPYQASNSKAQTVCVPQSKTWLKDAMSLLACEYEINDVWVEAGGHFASALLQSNLVDQLIIYQAPIVLGGDGLSLFGAMGLDRMEQSFRWQCLESRRIGPDIKTTYIPSLEA
ncbi:bifunctional diaminohydroxyphosphoribosylaminopyrimidine deaminase/5-amino-6-(5-phosphoribosylamino)uracil reductase RibD [Alginatibacterium sediminis]|uniref:Riboflavin biosynthesis protein RibD n=2 Tax=Alginatibacterium sediminis TaxID=2164068 RepID=A0A420EDW1_9ALTE|nr:bifunctional diaminohydroxyphosphoribosylaminopyrimidine deaminase/5-amino-6-(5-phosphoribosylamino)uracil reductase RibD [Alginatibacterium sediminis]